ncbi:MAG: polymer-forming cytoskeletal protein [Verrucomicrobia bacterium]|nr:polymer-forming cytoskeletal protein [Verrucomicrobiota bacterium]
MSMFSTRKPEPQPSTPPPPPPPPAARPTVIQPNGATETSKSGGVLSRGVSIKGTVKFSEELVIDGEVEGTIESGGKLTIGEHALIRGDIRTKSVRVRGTVEGDVFASERCELQAGCTLKGDIEAPRLIVDENAAFLGSAKVTPKS